MNSLIKLVMKMLNKIIDNYSSEFIALIGVLISSIIVFLKTKKTSLQKKLMQMNKEIALQFNPNDYYILYKDLVLDFDDVKIVKKEDYYHEKKNESSS